MSKTKSDKRDYVIYKQDDVGNGSMKLVKAKNLTELIKKNFPHFYNNTTADNEDDLAYELNAERNDVMVFDVKAKATVIGYS